MALNIEEVIRNFCRRLLKHAKDNGYCAFCKRDAPDGKCNCCKRCGCVLRPCRCEFDNEQDFFKYGEAFIDMRPVDPPKTRKCNGCGEPVTSSFDWCSCCVENPLKK